MAKGLYPLWCVVCRSCGFVHTVVENIGTEVGYVEHCPDCGHGTVTHQRVENNREHEAVVEGEVSYEEICERGTFDDLE